MTTRQHFALMASYNETMNQQVYAAAARLTPAELSAERGAFFGSILGTLNHLLVADTIWLQRMATLPARPPALDPVRAMPAPSGLGQLLETELAPLQARRRQLDALIHAFVNELGEDELARPLHYSNTKGVPFDKRLSSLLTHLFNHQTHHRGQASTLLFQAGQDIGVTDLLVLIPNEAAS
ncbi:DinB family protein [Rugamonas sp. CCM 8940]|uniref:DinB family protein n=1 Tax=Rugamonas sp. CCM 8940 TaxID=2765359 RepID=UPI0018F469B2|nr:DinB family protein [Rugamonas sp. CCM 8940]MBJ7311866.1 DinB family protein [Rugamonas sp. CCM 8940]